MLTKLHYLSQQVRWVACILTALFLQYGNVFAFEGPIAKNTSGEPYPHILKKETLIRVFWKHLNTAQMEQLER